MHDSFTVVLPWLKQQNADSGYCRNGSEARTSGNRTAWRHCRIDGHLGLSAICESPVPWAVLPTLRQRRTSGQLKGLYPPGKSPKCSFPSFATEILFHPPPPAHNPPAMPHWHGVPQLGGFFERQTGWARTAMESTSPPFGIPHLHLAEETPKRISFFGGHSFALFGLLFARLPSMSACARPHVFRFIRHLRAFPSQIFALLAAPPSLKTIAFCLTTARQANRLPLRHVHHPRADLSWAASIEFTFWRIFPLACSVDGSASSSCQRAPASSPRTGKLVFPECTACG